jgi:hypothetical protein
MPRPTTHRKSNAPRPSVTISLDPELNSQLRAEADRDGLALSWIIEDLIIAHFNVMSGAKPVAE